MSRRVLITGSSGFIGTNLVAHHLAKGDTVLACDVAPPREAAHGPAWRSLDLLDRTAVLATVADFAPMDILHFGARTDLRGSGPRDYAVNVDGTRHVIEAARETGGVRRIVHASSMLVCRNGVVPADETSSCPDTAYGESKAAMERLIRELDGPPWVIVRPTSIWGPWFGEPYFDFFNAVRRGRYATPSGVSARKALGYVGNTVLQVAALLDAPAAAVEGRVFYLADDPAPTIREWAQMVAAGWGVRRPRSVPQAVLWPVAWAGDALRAAGLMRSPPLTSTRLRNMATESWFDMAELQRIAGPPRFTAEQGVAATIAWMRARAT